MKEGERIETHCPFKTTQNQTQTFLAISFKTARWTCPGPLSCQYISIEELNERQMPHAPIEPKANSVQ